MCNTSPAPCSFHHKAKTARAFENLAAPARNTTGNDSNQNKDSESNNDNTRDRSNDDDDKDDEGDDVCAFDQRQ